MAVDPYEILGVRRAATREEITEAYRALAQIYHPDRYVNLPPRVQAEAETRMKQLSEAYDLIKRGAAPSVESATSPGRRSQWPRASRPSAPEELPVDVVGVPADALPPPTLPYSKTKWDAATRHWSWSEQMRYWECVHHKDVCQQCGATPDKISIDAGATRPPGTWRRSPRGEWICLSHRQPTCSRCGLPPDNSVVPVATAPRAPKKAPATNGRAGRVRWR